MDPSKTRRSAIAGLSASAVLLASLATSEGWSDRAIVPTKGDRPTVGFGSTFRDDGSPVKMGDTITPPKALARTLAFIQKDEHGIKQCVTTPLTQVEYDTMVDFSYQYGVKALCASTIVREANQGHYAASCRGYLLYKRAAGYDCSTPGNHRCPGVWARSQQRYRKCIGDTP